MCETHQGFRKNYLKLKYREKKDYSVMKRMSTLPSERRFKTFVCPTWMSELEIQKMVEVQRKSNVLTNGCILNQNTFGLEIIRLSTIRLINIAS